MTGKRATVLIAVVSFVIGFGVSWLIFGASRASAPTASEGEQMNNGSVAGEMTGGTENGGTAGETSGTSATGSEGTSSSSQMTEGAPTGAGSAIVASLQPAGPVAFVDRLVVPNRSWAVIYEDSRGRPGNILGARRFQPGTYTDETVALLRPTVPDHVYYAMIHSDDGDDSFDFTKDVPLHDESGALIMVRFQTEPETAL